MVEAFARAFLERASGQGVLLGSVLSLITGLGNVLSREPRNVGALPWLIALAPIPIALYVVMRRAASQPLGRTTAALTLGRTGRAVITPAAFVHATFVMALTIFRFLPILTIHAIQVAGVAFGTFLLTRFAVAFFMTWAVGTLSSYVLAEYFAARARRNA